MNYPLPTKEFATTEGWRGLSSLGFVRLLAFGTYYSSIDMHAFAASSFSFKILI
jgi:hypothetical protein